MLVLLFCFLSARGEEKRRKGEGRKKKRSGKEKREEKPLFFVAATAELARGSNDFLRTTRHLKNLSVRRAQLPPRFARNPPGGWVLSRTGLRSGSNCPIGGLEDPPRADHSQTT